MAKVKKKAAKGKAKSKASRKARPADKAAKSARKAKAKAKAARAKPAKAKAAKAEPASAKAAKSASEPKAKAAKAKPAKAKPAKAQPAKVAAAAGKATPIIDVGSLAPAFTLKDQSGASVSSDDLRGKPYVLYFYPKDDTSGCTAEACAFRDSSPRFGERGVRVIGVSPDSEASHQRFASKYGLPFTLLSDPEKQLIQAYGAWVEKQNYGRKYMGVQRSTFLVGADGTVQKAWRSVKVPGHVDAVLAAMQS